MCGKVKCLGICKIIYTNSQTKVLVDAEGMASLIATFSLETIGEHRRMPLSCRFVPNNVAL